MGSRFRLYIYPWARTPAYSAFVSLAGLFAGLLGALYADDIKSAFPFVRGNGPLSPHAVYFWVSALLATFLFFLAQRASESERQESENRLNTRSEELSKLVRTLPPSDFLSAFRKIVQDCNSALSNAIKVPISDLTRGDIQGTIRVVLAGVATLAQKFDAASEDTNYAANIMMFSPSDRLDEQQIGRLKGILKFSPPETDLRALKGILILERELSTTTQTEDPAEEPDKSLTPLALAVPRSLHDSSGRRWRVLPGAPMAFCTGDLEAYLDTKTLVRWCRSEGDFPESIASEIDEYFNSERAQQIRSFVCLPLKNPSAEPIGVLNVHRDRTGLLEEKEPARQFAPLVSPLVSIILMLLDRLRMLDDNMAKQSEMDHQPKIGAQA